MDVWRISKKYCTDKRVQMFIPRVKEQILFSVDEWLFLHKDRFDIHKHNSELHSVDMSFHEKMISTQSIVLNCFKYDTVYVNFLSSRNIYACTSDADTYSLSFFYFFKEKNGDAIGCQMYLADFETDDEQILFLDQNQLERFLYGVPYPTGSKYILEWGGGIKYAKIFNEKRYISASDFVDFSEKAIIKKYNLQIDAKNHIKVRNIAGSFSKVHDICDVEQFSLTSSGMYLELYPLMITCSKNSIQVAEIDIIFCGVNSYKVRIYNRKIIPNFKQITRLAKKAKVIE